MSTIKWNRKYIYNVNLTLLDRLLIVLWHVYSMKNQLSIFLLTWKLVKIVRPCAKSFGDSAKHCYFLILLNDIRIIFKNTFRRFFFLFACLFVCLFVLNKTSSYRLEVLRNIEIKYLLCFKTFFFMYLIHFSQFA